MLTITGTSNQAMRSYIERVYNFLNLDMYDAFIDVNIVSSCDGMVAGFCHGDDEEVIVEVAKVDSKGKLSTKDMMIAIAHELVHAQQYASGRLIDKGVTLRTNSVGETVFGSKKVFEGELYENVAYNDQLWEKEAYDLENKIYEECK